MAAGLELRQFNVREANWQADRNTLSNIRRLVFIVEQQVPREEEWDGRDESAWHWLATDQEDRPVGTARLLPDGQIGRMAVLREYRGHGVGKAMLEQAVQKAGHLGMESVFLNAQTHALAFYEASEFEVEGEEFDEAGIPHRRMTRKLPAPSHNTQRYPASQEVPDVAMKDFDTAEEAVYTLGRDNQILLLRRKDEFIRAIVEMARQARQSLKIYSPLLDHTLYDRNDLREICSALARKNRYTSVEILVHDSHRIVKNGHALLGISRKLSSSIAIRIVHPDYRQLNHEYLLADTQGIVYRTDHEVYEGSANFHDVPGNNRLRREFLIAWETSLNDPNLRQLKI